MDSAHEVEPLKGLIYGETVINVENKKIKVGKWKYVIWLASSTILVSFFAHTNSFGMLYNDFFVEYNIESGRVNFIFGITSTTVSFMGIVSNLALKKFTVRQIGLFGAILYVLSWSLIYFITSINQMILTAGVMHGIGVGLIIPIMYSVFNDYFVTKKMAALSFCQMTEAISTFIYPFMAKVLLENYGYRGASLIISAVVANVICAVLVMHPVEWHLEGDVDLKTIKQEEFKLETVISKEDIPKRKTLWYYLVKYLDLDLLKDAVFFNIVIGISISMVSDALFYILLPMYLYSIELPTDDVVTLLALTGGADLVSRGTLGIFTRFIPVKGRVVFFVATIGSSILRFIFIYCNDFWSLFITLSVMGFLRGWLEIPISLIHAEYIPERFAAAYGLNVFFWGNLNSIILPILGFIRDYTDSFALYFHLTVILSLFCTIPWTIEYVYFKMKDKKINR